MKENITKISQVTPEVTLFLRSLGLSNYYIIKIFDLVEDAAIALTEENPYWILEEFPRFGFERADKVAKLLGKEDTDPDRIEAAICYVLGAYAGEGHSYAPYNDFSYKVAEFLKIPSEYIRDAVEEMTYGGKIQLTTLAGEQVIYFYSFFKAEREVVRLLSTLSDPSVPVKPVAVNLESAISKAESKGSVKLSREQRNAVENAVLSPVSIITGGPGTGKTTVLKTIIALFEDAKLKVKVACPTGRAAKRAMEATGHYASTIHRLLEACYDETIKAMKFLRNENNPLECDVLIVDESSMIDLILMERLLLAIKVGTRVVFVGDANQLPSVGAGNVLSDMIESEYFSIVKLNHIYRQGLNSMIIENAHKINLGEHPELAKVKLGDLKALVKPGKALDLEEVFYNFGDFLYVNEQAQDNILRKIVSLVSLFEKENVQILTPMKKGIIGNENINTTLRDVFNPKEEKPELEFGKKTFRVGDRVMQIKNNYQVETRSFNDSKLGKVMNPMVSFTEEQKGDKSSLRVDHGVFNGEIGKIEAVDVSKKTVTVCYDEERWVEYPYTMLEELEHAYSITIHKSQGSEFPVVIIPISWCPERLATRSLIYTAITRGKNLVILVGEDKYLNAMVENDRSSDRNSGLKKLLVSLYDI